MKTRQRKCRAFENFKVAGVTDTESTCRGWHFPEVSCLAEGVGVLGGCG